jgi:hypothetical protein
MPCQLAGSCLAQPAVSLSFTPVDGLMAMMVSVLAGSVLLVLLSAYWIFRR